MPDVSFSLLLPMDWPYVISSRFNSPRSYPFAPKRLQLHEGIDFAPKQTTTATLLVRASQRGVVDKIGFDSKGYGNYVRVSHQWGTERFVTWYAHLAEVRVQENDYVNAGDVLGVAGSTGNSTGIHVHLTLQHIGKGLKNYVVDDVIDPEPFLSASINNFDEAWWVADVTVDDHTPIFAGQPFRKTWRIRNAGTSTWTKSYALGYFSDDQMSGPASVALPAAKPGEDVEVSVDLVAPTTTGISRSTWKPRNAQGRFFDYAIYTEIEVLPPQSTAVNEARYVDDVTIPYDTPMKPGQPFRKTWRLRNTGSTTWGSGYRLVFAGDDQMGGPAAVDLPTTQPGEDAEVSLDLIAPTTAGKVKGTWQPCDPQGNLFDYPVRVEIIVIPTAQVDNAAFVSDVIVVQPNQTFVKLWRILNSGQTRWGDGYSFVFLEGTAMNAPQTTPVPSTKPGVQAEISVTMTAPATPGIYTSQWELRNPDGQGFGPIYSAQIEVRG